MHRPAACGRCSGFSGTNAAAYESKQAVAEYVGARGLRPIEEELICEFFRPGEEVLDLGCGAGRTTSAMLALGFRVVGLDLSAALLDKAALSCPGAAFMQADVRQLPFADQSFSQVLFSYNGLDYVYPFEQLLRALIEIGRVLRPGGVFIYSGHNIIGRFGRDLASPTDFVRAWVRAHPCFLAIQRRGFEPHRWYWRYGESFGELVTFSAPPCVHRRLHRLAGFETLRVSGPDVMRSERWAAWREHHVHYVVRKR